MQEFNVKIDKGFMMSLYDVFANLMATEESEVNFANILHPHPSPHPPVQTFFCQVVFLYFVVTLKMDRGFMMSLKRCIFNLMEVE